MNSDEFEGIINFIREGNYAPEAQPRARLNGTTRRDQTLTSWENPT